LRAHDVNVSPDSNRIDRFGRFATAPAA
jgi:hypothetical protein